MESSHLAKFLAKLKGKERVEKKSSRGGEIGAEDTNHNQKSTLPSTAAADRGVEDVELSARARAQIDRNDQSLAKRRVDGTALYSAGAPELGQAEETVQISGGEQNESVRTNEESLVDTIPPTFTCNTLWDEAYKSLKEDKEKAKFVEAYEKILSRVFLKENTLDTTSPSDQNGENAIAQDPPSREKQIRQIIEKGLEKIEKAKDRTEVYEKFFDLVKPFKAVLDTGLQNVPQAALPWAIVSSSLDVSELKTSIICQEHLLITVGTCRFLPSRQKQARSYTQE
jgi:hypothetical protein